jgi:uracil-DNA glycosylase
MNIKDFQQKIYESLIPSGWGHRLKGFLLSDEFTTIIQTLYDESESGLHFTPVFKHMFSAFHKCKFEDVKVVFIGAGPYKTLNHANGMLFSNTVPVNEPKPLMVLFDAIEKDVYNGGPYDRNRDLTRWAEQGILLLNSSLTAVINSEKKHDDLWKPFYTYLFDVLNSSNTGIVYVFFGECRTWHKNISVNNYKMFIPYPVYEPTLPWANGNLFNNINRIINDVYKTTIIW